MFFSREGELRAFKRLAERGFGPALLATLEDGRVEEFLEGKVSRSHFPLKQVTIVVLKVKAAALEARSKGKAPGCT